MSLWYLDRLSLSKLPGMLLNAAVFQMSHELQIRTVERRLPRSQDHVHSGPEPLSELILHSQFTAENDYLHTGFIISIVSDSDCTGTETGKVFLPWFWAGACARLSARWACKCPSRPTRAASRAAAAGDPQSTRHLHPPGRSSTGRAGNPTPPAQVRRLRLYTRLP